MEEDWVGEVGVSGRELVWSTLQGSEVGHRGSSVVYGEEGRSGKSDLEEVKVG